MGFGFESIALSRLMSELDRRGVAWVRGLPHPRAVDRPLIALSRATDHSTAWFALGAAGVVIDRRRRRAWMLATARMAFAEIAVRAVKRGPRRARPSLDALPPLAPATSPLSFPSSHTTAAVAALAAFSGLVPRPLLRAVAAATAFSRLYLGLHYPSDVAGGALLGQACAWLTRPRRGGATDGLSVPS